MAELAFFLLGLIVGFVWCAAVAASIDKSAAKEGVWKHDGVVYKLTKIEP